MRATNLQELVYKNGQAGVTKATVTITFDNTDKKQSPIGYDHYNEVTITRQVLFFSCCYCEFFYCLLFLLLFIRGIVLVPFLHYRHIELKFVRFAKREF